MSGKIGRSDILRHFEGRQIHLDDLEPHYEAIKAQVARANEGIPKRLQITPEQFVARLKAQAGTDGIIRREEIEGLFGLLDKLDLNHDGNSFDAFGNPGQPETAVRPSPASNVVSILSQVRRNPNAIGLERFKNIFQGGVIDASALRRNPELRETLVQTGLDMRAFDRLFDDQGELSAANLPTLFRLIDALDSNDDGGSFDTTEASLELEAAKATPAGLVVGVLLRSFRRFDQQFHQYTDLSRAAGGHQTEQIARNARGVELQQRTQQTKTGCFDACIEMLRRFDAAVARRVEHPSRTLRMTRAEDESGALAGWKDDFDRGRGYIDACLEAGRPVIVGLSHSDRGTNWRYDRATDHFVVIRARGVDEAGRLYYEFADPASSHPDEKIGRFYVDSGSGMLFRPPLNANANDLYGRDWQVSQVRPYSDMPVDETLARRAARSLQAQ